MTLAAPRSRQGKAYLVLAFLVVAAAAVGTFLWVSNARADITSTSVVLTSNQGATANPGDTITYTATVTQVGVPGGTITNTKFTVTLDATNISSVTFPVANDGDATPWVAAECGYAAGVVTCTDPTGPADSDVVTINAVVAPGANNSVDPPTACNVSDDGTGQADCTNAITAVPVSGGATASPATATNLVGTPHTITYTLFAGVTCASDNVVDNPATGNDANRDCGASDVAIAPVGCAAVTAGPTVVGTVLAAQGDVTVTILGTSPNTCTIALHLRFEGILEICINSVQGAVPCEDGGDDTALADVTAEKIYETATGELCHLDIPDAASEDASGNTDGFLYVDKDPGDGCIQDDVDDAVGSFHAACLGNSNLTSADNADITWVIQNNGGNPNVNPPGGIKFAGPNDEPCVRWGSGATGTQAISATWDPGVVGVAPVQFFWDESDLPLIKEWNTIDFTKIIGVSGDVGDTLADNSGELDDWSSRDCIDSGFCARANLDGTTHDISGVLFPFAGKDCPPFSGGCISANGASYIDYTMGSHSDAGGAYSGPVDGAAQNYSVEGDCGSVRLEDPTTGNVIILFPGDDADVLSSDMGVGFQVLPNADGATSTTPSNADCQADSCLTVTIDTEEDNLFHSPPLLTADTETIEVCFHVGPPTNKQPLLAWAGQRVVLEHDWSFTDVNDNRSCPFGIDSLSTSQGGSSFFVRYLKEFGNGGFVSDFGQGAATGPDFMVVRVFTGGDSNTDPEDQCISRVMYESQDQGEQDVVAHVVACAPVFIPLSASVQGGPNIDPDTCSVISEQVAFLVYYMKFEDIKLALLPDATTHDATSSQSSTAVGAPAGAATTTANVSANVLARATVRGWVLTDNCPARESAVGSNGEFIPANRCIFPDDWLFKAGGDASDARRNYDNYGGSTAGCSNVAGPYSLLDPIVFDSEGFRDIVCGDSMAPYAPYGNPAHRETNFPDGVIDANDAPMPSALIRFVLNGSGFLLGAEKHNPNSQFDVTHIPAEPWISPINADGSGYQWNSWGVGPKGGVYHYWTDLADHGPEVLSCAGSSSGVTATSGECDAAGDVGVPTGGYQLTRVYSDEHGVAMTWINGDANLTFEGCASTVAAAGHQIVLLKGFFCQPDNIVGSSTLNALADYPDKRKHFAILSDDVTITWTWGGIKSVTVEDGAGPQFHYVVLHVTDRDGFCGNSPSLHPVLGEDVEFVIDSDAGVIVPNANGDAAAAPGGTSTVSDHGKSASTTTFDTADQNSIADGGWTVEPVQQNGECQAWIHISASIQEAIDVIVTAFDPEGTVTFDTVFNQTPTPSPEPTDAPTPTPFTLHLKWGDSDCDGNVAPRDGQAVLKHFLDQAELSQSQPCPAMGERVMVGGDEVKWGDWDCNGSVAPRDGQADLKHFLSQAELSQTEPCPDIASAVDVIPLVP